MIIRLLLANPLKTTSQQITYRKLGFIPLARPLSYSMKWEV